MGLSCMQMQDGSTLHRFPFLLAVVMDGLVWVVVVMMVIIMPAIDWLAVACNCRSRSAR